eukprot:scaffold14107_cov124-Isochrysis_galbana.AAC.6
MSEEKKDAPGEPRATAMAVRMARAGRCDAGAAAATAASQAEPSASMRLRNENEVELLLTRPETVAPPRPETAGAAPTPSALPLPSAQAMPSASLAVPSGSSEYSLVQLMCPGVSPSNMSHPMAVDKANNVRRQSMASCHDAVA